jgi:spore germination cell wall hydrolase CwlJ-like protein
MKRLFISLVALIAVSYPAFSKDQPPKPKVYQESPTECLVQALFYEAYGEGYEGQVAVGWVVRNRINSGKFPKTACKVINQRSQEDCQFTFICYPYRQITPEKYMELYLLAGHILYDAYMHDPTGGALYFNNKPFKNKGFKFIKKIGNHWFYTDAN